MTRHAGNSTTAIASEEEICPCVNAAAETDPIIRHELISLELNILQMLSLNHHSSI